MFLVLWNFLLNQMMARLNLNGQEPSGSSGESGQDSAPSPPSLSLANLPVRNVSGIFALFSEMINLVRRMDKRYADSRKYQNIGNTRHDGKVAVITGGDRDIGAEAAASLAKDGFRIIIGVKEDQSLEKVNPSVPLSSNIKILKLDLSLMESVREFAKEVSKLEPKIDLLINASEVFESQKVLTRDGIERNFSENYLGHFLLTNLLINNLKKAENGRIINVSSTAHYFGIINFRDINHNKFYVPIRAHAQSKLAQVLFTREMSKRLIETNVTVYVVSPEIIRKQISLPNNPQINEVLQRVSDPVNGAQTLLYVALEDSLKNESGFYYTNLKKVHPLLCNASDDSAAEKLWELSEEMTKLDEEHKIKSIRRGINSRQLPL